MIGNYTGTKTLAFKVNPAKVTTKFAFKLSAASYIYTGKANNPVVTVKDVAGKTLVRNKDYTLTYSSGRKNVGTYKVVVKMIGNYTGSKILAFKVLPKAASINKLTAKSKAIVVKLNRSLQQSTGYEIQYSTKKSFSSKKTVTVKGYSKTSKKISKLKKKKKYYVRIRTYYPNGDTGYIYSKWSATKTVKTK